MKWAHTEVFGVLVPGINTYVCLFLSLFVHYILTCIQEIIEIMFKNPGGWTKNTPKHNFFEKRQKSSKTQKLKNI